MSATEESQIDAKLEQLSDLWDQAIELHDQLEQLPAQDVLRSGLSGTRNSLLSKFESLETPGLDGTVSNSSLDSIRKWIRSSKICLSGIQNSKSLQSILSNSESEYFELISSIEEAEFISDRWCWPWANAANKDIIGKVKPTTKSKLLKIGSIGIIGAMAVASYMDVDE